MRATPAQPKMIRAQLVRAMKTGEYADQEHLPPESVLSEKLGISRTQLRDVLAGLEREGFITRRHGIGTVINRHVLAVQTRMDIELEFMDMIRQSGYEPGVARVQVTEDTADSAASAQLQIPEGAGVIRFSKLCTADGIPAIYCEDLVAREMVGEGYTPEDLQQPIFHILQQFCGASPYLDLTDLRPVVADAALAEIFQIPVGTPLLHMDEVDFDIDGKPVFCSSEYFADGIFRHTVMRKKL